MKLLLANWMKELDAETINQIGIPSIVLMENASQGAASFFARQFPLENGFNRVVVIAGKGNNGGDGLAVGRIMHQMGYDVEFVLLSEPGTLNPDPKINFNIIQNLNLTYSIIDSEKAAARVFEKINRYHKQEVILIDAIFGTGIDRPVKKGRYWEIIREINETGFKVAAIDLPSGLSEAFLPEEGIHVTADVTATFQCLKTAHLHPDGNKYCGTIEIIDIGIPKELVAREKYYIEITTPGAIRELLENREIDAHKGSFGHGLTIAGSVEKPGAGILSSFALLKSGAGLCTAAVCFENRTTAAHPELMTLVYKKNSDLLARLKQFSVLLAGPGMGDNTDTFELVSLLLVNSKVPVVLDADALNVLSGNLSLLENYSKTGMAQKKREFPIVLTPHPGEFSRLTGRKVPEIRAHRIELVREFAAKYNVYVILKGHHTVTATPEGRVYVNATGNPGMATAGSGDVLSGMLAGMIAAFGKNHSMDKIVQAAVFIHGCAGDLAAMEKSEICLTASDILNAIPHAILRLKSNEYGIPFGLS